jgi:hypothetical protein
MAIPTPAPPNLFNLEGDGATISYATTSIAGVPQFSYRDSEHNVSKSGTDDIRRLETEIGALVTIDLAQIPDLQTIKVTLVVPTVNLPQPANSSDLQTIAILTTSRTTIGGPNLVVGQIETYRTLYLRGTARKVTF